MGYTTTFEGQISIDPPLNETEIEYINKFNEVRHMDRKNGPYYVDGTGYAGQGHDRDIINHNQPPKEQPSLWCQWMATEDGEYIEWDEGEKFYSAPEWMQYIIEHFLGNDPIAKRSNPRFEFLQGHTLNGEIFACGEEDGDVWKLVVDNNNVTVKEGRITYDE